MLFLDIMSFTMQTMLQVASKLFSKAIKFSLSKVTFLSLCLSCKSWKRVSLNALFTLMFLCCMWCWRQKKSSFLLAHIFTLWHKFTLNCLAIKGSLLSIFSISIRKGKFRSLTKRLLPSLMMNYLFPYVINLWKVFWQTRWERFLGFSSSEA